MAIANHDYEIQLTEWRRLKEDELTTEDGWLSLVGLHWLSDGANSLGTDPSLAVALSHSAIPAHIGEITLRDNLATLSISADVEVLVDGQLVCSTLLRDDQHELGPSRIQIDSLTLTVIRRADAYAVRVRDRNAPERLSFAGRSWFAPDTAFRVSGQFIPFGEPREYTINNTVGQQIAIASPGIVEFEIQGAACQLVAFPAEEAQQLWFVFRDRTSGRQTYGACRFLSAIIETEGRVEMDFNRAYHPPCAFTAFATCPLPPTENHLAVAITAGECLPRKMTP